MNILFLVALENRKKYQHYRLSINKLSLRGGQQIPSWFQQRLVTARRLLPWRIKFAWMGPNMWSHFSRRSEGFHPFRPARMPWRRFKRTRHMRNAITKLIRLNLTLTHLQSKSVIFPSFLRLGRTRIRLRRVLRMFRRNISRQNLVRLLPFGTLYLAAATSLLRGLVPRFIGKIQAKPLKIETAAVCRQLLDPLQSGISERRQTTDFRADEASFILRRCTGRGMTGHWGNNPLREARISPPYFPLAKRRNPTHISCLFKHRWDGRSINPHFASFRLWRVSHRKWFRYALA